MIFFFNSYESLERLEEYELEAASFLPSKYLDRQCVVFLRNTTTQHFDTQTGFKSQSTLNVFNILLDIRFFYKC